MAVERLNRRLVAIYESGTPSTIDFILGATSIDEMLEKVNYITLIGKEDREIATQVALAKAQMQAARVRTSRWRERVAGEVRVIAAREAQERATRDALVNAKNELDATRHQKVISLSELTAQERAVASELDALQAVSDQLAAQIRAAQARSQVDASSSSASGLIWPVNGPVTSPFGMRWGRLHTGIDIGAATGYPISAAAAGVVIFCGWEQGYGNLVVLDNGNGLSTAYAHQSSIAVSCGQQVNQGDVIGFVGCTGHCYGPHLHFEVRIDGNPVDPLGYL
jgi:murein DD-endopeptidase MepM/ murein hydrolase activator NlpD